MNDNANSQTTDNSTTPEVPGVKILFLNNDGAGFADYVDIPADTTISSFLSNKLPYRSPGDLLIRVNRQPVESGYVLKEGDRVSATPTKIEGAHRRK